MTTDTRWPIIETTLLGMGLSTVHDAIATYSDDDGTSSVNRSLIVGLVDYLTETVEPCDHSVNICCCGERAILMELSLWLDGRRTCPTCNGDCFDYDSADNNDDHTPEKCGTCHGAGTVELPKG